MSRLNVRPASASPPSMERLRHDVERAQEALDARENALIAEIEMVRQFVLDVRLGIRDLSEYEAVCGT